MLVLCNAEIDNVDLIVDRQHDAVGLDVPMGYVVAMGVVQYLRTLLHKSDDAFRREQLIRLATWPESPKILHVFHGKVRPSFVVTDVVNTQNVRMTDRVNDLGFVQKHSLRHITAKLDCARCIYLDGDLAIDDRIVIHVDGSHAAATGNAQDRVLTQLFLALRQD